MNSSQMNVAAVIERAVIVDDDPQVRTALEKGIRRLGYDVVSAKDGEEGLRTILDLHPQVVLMDIRMPGMDGHTLLRRLVAHGERSAVIVMSAHGDLDDVIDVLRNGAVDYLKKPWTPSELVAAMGRAREISDQRLSTALEGEATKAQTTSGSAGERAVASHPPALSKERASSMSMILDRLKCGEIPVPSIPSAIQALRTAVRRPDVTVDEIASLIDRDQNLAAQVLKLSNSAQYSRSGRSNSIRTAVGRIGLRQVQCIVETVGARGCYRIKNPEIQNIQAQIWSYSVTKAVAMRAIVERCAPVRRLDPETAYVAGLLLDTGASFLLWVIAEREPSSQVARFDSPEELACLHQFHEEIGALVLTRWEMDPSLIQLAQSHHRSAPSAPPHGYWCANVLASSLADEITSGGDVTRKGEIDAALSDRCGTDLRIGNTVMKEMLDHVRRETQEILSNLA